MTDLCDRMVMLSLMNKKGSQECFGGEVRSSVLAMLNLSWWLDIHKMSEIFWGTAVKEATVIAHLHIYLCF